MICAALTSEDFVKAVTCTADTFVLVSNADYEALVNNNLATVLNEIFAFDMVVFSFVLGTCMTSFVVAHGAGRVVRWLGK